MEAAAVNEIVRGPKDECFFCKRTALQDGEGEDWIECTQCKQWLHIACAEVDPVPTEDEDWFCPDCRFHEGAEEEESIVQTILGGDANQNVTDSNEETRRRELKMLEELIREKEEIFELRKRHLNLLNPDYAPNTNERVNEWLNCSVSQRGQPRLPANASQRQTQSLAVQPPRDVLQNIVNRGVIRRPPTVPPMVQTIASSINETSPLEKLLERQMKMMCRQYLEELPEFDGNEEMWPMFYTQYCTTTTEGGFDDAHNLCRLRKCLKGEAMRAVMGTINLPNSLPDVIRILERRFGNTEVLIRRKMKRFCDIPAPNENKPATVKIFYEFIQDFIATLKNLNAINYLNSPHTLDVATEKLSPGMSRSWIMYKKNLRQEVNLEHLLTWFEPYYECAIIKDREQHPMESTQKRSSGRVNVHDEENVPTVAVAVVPDKRRNENYHQCGLCRSGDHNLTTCNKFKNMNIKQKWNFIRQRRWCFMCLVAKHRYADCDKKKICGIEACSEPHHQLLHRSAEKPFVRSVVRATEPSSSPQVSAEKHAVCSQSNKSLKTYFRVLPVTLHNNERKVDTWAFLDEGSSPTMLCETIAEQLGVEGVIDELCTSWTDDSVRSEPMSRRVTIEISGLNMSKKFTMRNCRTVSQLQLPMPDVDLLNLAKRFKHLEGIDIPHTKASRPGILIGLEHAKLGLMFEIREGNWNEPVASRTRLGWTIHGKEDGFADEYVCHVCECRNNDDELNEAVREFFTTESFGVRLPLKPLESKDIETAREILQNTTKKIGNQFETGLLWKNPDIILPDNKKMAMKRLICFEQKLQKNPELRREVQDKIDTHVQKGYLRKLSFEELQNLDERRWYLPIFAINNPNKPGKTRIVFDAAATYSGTSLNDALLKGPDQLASLFGVLIKFREGRIAVTADIAEMFHRIKIIPKDQNFQLVLWRDMDNSRPPDTYVMTAMSFGASCSPSSAQYVKNYNARQYEDEYPRAVEAIVNRHYVDDLLDSFESEEEALKIAREVKHIHLQGGFNIRNWLSNSGNIMHLMNSDSEEAVRPSSLKIAEESSTEKVLGMYWDLKLDVFKFKLSFGRVKPEIVNNVEIPTKREVLRIIMSLYDPMGMLSAVIVSAKIFMQEVWRSGVTWDEKIIEELKFKWSNWLEALQKVTALKIPRCYLQNVKVIGRVELHIFADSSEEAFAAATYLRIESNDGNEIDVTLVAAKTRVAPQKPLTVPRLELQAAVLATRLKNTVMTELSFKVDEVILWSDSLTVLGWIRSSKRKFSTFVSHRIGEILDSTTVTQWRWVPSKENVADDATRSMEHPEVTARWFCGPDFLKNNASLWPVERVKVTSTTEEVKAINVHVNAENHYERIHPSRFSKWERLLRSTAYVLRYVNILKQRIKSEVRTSLLVLNREEIEYEDVPPLTLSELNSAEEIIFKKIQHESYFSELEQLRRKGVVSRRSKIFNFNPRLDERGLIRLSGRLDVTPPSISDQVKQPLVLDRDHAITKLIIDAVHRKFRHIGKETIVNELRQRVWIPKLRVEVNKMFKSCRYCSYLRAKPKIPMMAPLPASRLAVFQPAFTNTGVDFFGPINVTVARHKEKRWGVLFVCLTTRAIHLELASTLDTSSTIMCYRNFINRRGPPLKIISDNGTNLRSAERELKEAVQKLNQNQIQNELTDLVPTHDRIEWSFIPPAAPHFGGSWERMIRTVKDALYKILKAKAPRDETLRSALIEAENIVNSRPLTYTAEDVDSKEAITPNHLLKGTPRAVESLPGEVESRKQWRVAQALANEFWTRWLKEYLPTIAKRTKWHTESKPLKVGKLVLLMDENTPRAEWRRGIVDQVFPSNDGRIRTVKVRTAKGLYTRPVSKLAIIDDHLDTTKI